MVSRRNFIKQLGIATAGLSLDPLGKLTASAAPAKPKQPATKEKVKVAFIGIGNRGEQDVEEFEKTGMIDVVALCDVDLDGKQCQKVLAKYPNAKRFRDFREMFEKYSNQFDAVIAAVPDLIHFPIAMTALSYGKHIYLEKPMTRTFLEAELLMAQAKKHPELVTQVGNQGHSEGNYFSLRHGKKPA